MAANSTTRGQFNAHTTRQISGKYTQYWDGVVVNGTRGAHFSATFTKVGDGEATVGLYDSFQNQLTESSDDDSAWVTNYTLPYTGLYEVIVQGENEGNFSLSVSQPVALNAISLKPTKAYLKVGQKCQLTLAFSPSNATDKAITWSMSQSQIATISANGVVTAKTAGTVLITATSDDGYHHASSTIVVSPVPLKSIKLKQKKATVKLHHQLKLHVVFNPSNATNRAVTWSSSKRSIASVSASGVVHPRNVGKTVITVRTKRGNMRATEKITVKR